jgi:hypothetical protein
VNATSFAVMTRELTSVPARRHVLRGLAGTGLVLGIARWPAPADARTRRQRTKATPNACACLGVGQTCQHAAYCCSGICEGETDERTCRAHGTGTCDQDGPGLCSTPVPGLIPCNDRDDCACIRTTAGSNFCYDAGAETSSDCADCQADADCAALGFPPGSACVPFSDGVCAGSCASGMACMVPCGDEPPEL